MRSVNVDGNVFDLARLCGSGRLACWERSQLYSYTIIPTSTALASLKIDLTRPTWNAFEVVRFEKTSLRLEAILGGPVVSRNVIDFAHIPAAQACIWIFFAVLKGMDWPIRLRVA